MDFKTNKPIYQQIVDFCFSKILTREWTAGERIVSVRELSTQLAVNSRTVLKAYEYLQAEDIIYPERGMGFYLSKDAMKKVMKKDLEKIKKIYGFERKTELTNAKAAVVKALPIEEKEVVFVMDRFGYSKILDKSTYERNEETVLKEYRHIVHCMNTDKVCVFTDTGVMHQIKVQDIPSGRLRDKGTPLDNIGNYDSRNEQILLIAPDRTLKESSLLFVTAASMVKIVDGAEFIVQKKTVAATKLAEGDTLTAVRIVSAKESITNAQIIMQSEEGYFLRFPLEEVTRKKKGAIGIRGMKLQEQDHVKHIYLTGVEEEDTPSIIYKEKELVFSKIRLMGRDGKGVKVRR